MEVKIVKKLKKAAIISAMVLMISIVPAFALNDTNNTNGTQDQTQTQQKNQTQTQDQSGTADQNCQKNCDGQNCGTCDEDQHKYQYGQKNGNASANNSGNDNDEQHKYQYGLKNDDASAKNCVKNSNCPKN
jgi:hypothetical protein